MDLHNHPGMFLNDGAALSLKRLEDDHGVQPLTDAGRTKEKQQGFIDRWDRGGVYNRPPYLYEPARPPETSSHVKNGGEAVDVTNWRWWRENAAEYGWVVDFDWDVVHFRYDPTKDQHILRGNIPAEMESELFYAVNKKTGAWFLVIPQGNAKPRAVLLGAGAVKAGNLPVIEFEWDKSIDGLMGAVDGFIR